MCPAILVILFVISGVGPRCIQNMVTKFQQLQYADEYSNLLIISSLITWYGLCLVLLGWFQADFEKAFFTILVGVCAVAYFLKLFAEFCCGLYVIRSFHRVDFSESLAIRLIVGDVNRLLIDDLRAVNVFQDLTGPYARALVIGISQIILIGMYVWGLWLAGRPDFSDPQVYAFYLLGIFLGYAYLIGKEAQLFSKVRSFNFWFRTIHAVTSSKHSITAKDGNVVEINWNSLWIRWFLCTVANSLGQGLVVSGLPLQVAQRRDPIDFVLNAVAAFYIIEIDDIEPIEYKIVQTEQEDNDTTSGYQEEPGPNGPADITADSTSSDRPEQKQNDSTTSGDQVEQDHDETNVQVSLIQKWICIQYHAVLTLRFALVHGDKKSPDIEEGGGLLLTKRRTSC